MKTIRRPNQYLQLRGEVWHYIRRVPSVVVKEIGSTMKRSDISPTYAPPAARLSYGGSTPSGRV